MKAIKIDVEKRDVYEIEIGKDYRQIYPAIGNGCNVFVCPVEFPNNDVMYVDDESLLGKEINGGFIMPDWSTPIVGNAVILGTDDEGESKDYASNLDEIRSSVTFIDLDKLLRYKDDVLSRGPIVFSF